MITINNIWKAVLAVIICEAAGLVGAAFTAPEIPTWYAHLEKASLNPPSWVFGPVWTLLYAMMGVSLYLVWKQRPVVSQDPMLLLQWRWGIGVFFLQLGVNVFWSYLFFRQHDLFGALLDIILMGILILATSVLFYRISRTASLLFIPYFLWVNFATYLNFAVWTLNS